MWTRVPGVECRAHGADSDPQELEKRTVTRILVDFSPSDHDFKVGKEDFADLEIRPAGAANEKLHYFYHRSRRTFVKRFILHISQQVLTVCVVTLIRGDDGRFEPRVTIAKRDRATDRIAELLIVDEGKATKARVDLDECHDNFWALIGYIHGLREVDVPREVFAVLPQTSAELVELLRDLGKREAIEGIVDRYGKVSDADVALLTRRRDSLDLFRRLLEDATLFAGIKSQYGAARDEDVWQRFFEENQWIFGHGLQLVSCSSLDGRKLENIVVGHDALNGPGKRIDGLLKSKGSVSRFLFCEIKRHDTELLERGAYRSGVFPPSNELIGAIAQIQKTLHLVAKRATQDFARITQADGTPTGEEIAVVRPRGVVVAGALTQFSTDRGVNYERFASFELFRQQIAGIDIITFDELYARAEAIVG